MRVRVRVRVSVSVSVTGRVRVAFGERTFVNKMVEQLAWVGLGSYP